MSDDPHARAMRDINRAAQWSARLASAQAWLYITLVGVPVLLVCVCCGYALIRS